MNTTKVITLDDMPGRSVIAQFNDVHIPHDDHRALKLAVECAEDNGCTHTILNGDILDSGQASRHPNKKALDTINLGAMDKAINPGRWFLNWARSKQCYYLLGNHERWAEALISSDPALSAVQPMDLFRLPRDGEGWTVLPSNSRLRLGSFVWEHGHGIFPSGTGGQNPGARIKSVAPQQTTFIGHLHRDFFLPWTTPNELGIDKIHAAYGTGHMSLTKAHEGYAGGYPGWQQSFRMTYIYEVDKRPRMTTDSIIIHRDHRNRPVFEYRGKVYH